MEIFTGKISKQAFIPTQGEGRKGRRFLQFLGFGTKKREYKQMQPFGLDSAPVVGSFMVAVQTQNKKNSCAIGTIDSKNRKSKEGETRLYATDSEGNKVFDFYLTAEGEAVFDEGAFSSVRFQELKTAFDQLKSDFDSLVTKFNAHLHTVSAAPGTTTPTSSPANPSAADVSGAESPTIKIP